jgi:RNA polymerase sigma-70 factor (ECF subfamily)
MFTPEAIVAERPNLHRFALRLTRNASDADDLVQATLLRALEKKEMFETGTNLFSWASRIMFNLFATQYRRRRRFETQFDPATVVEQASIGPHQEQAAELSRVRDCMKLLSPEHRTIITMVCLRGLRYEEVSAALRIPVGTVRSRLSRARNHLQELFDSGAPYRRPGTDLIAGHRGAA